MENEIQEQDQEREPAGTAKGDLQVIVAEVAPEETSPDASATATAALAELDRRISELEAAMGDLRTVTASAAAAREATPASNGRKTHPPYAAHLLAKGAEPVRNGGVDAALGSLSVEQRIAVKAGLLRAGLL